MGCLEMWKSICYNVWFGLALKDHFTERTGTAVSNVGDVGWLWPMEACYLASEVFQHCSQQLTAASCAEGNKLQKWPT